MLQTIVMKTVISVGILFLIIFCFCVRAHDISLFNFLPTFKTLRYRHKLLGHNLPRINNNRPKNCLKEHGLLYAINEKTVQQKKPNLHLMSKNLLLVRNGSSLLKRKLDVGRASLNSYIPLLNTQSNVHNSGQHAIHGSMLGNTLFFNHSAYNYEVTTASATAAMNRISFDSSIRNTRGIYEIETTTGTVLTNTSELVEEDKTQFDNFLFVKFKKSLEKFERKFYQTTYNRLISISPEGRLENGISFALSGLFLYLALMALSVEVDFDTSAQIDTSLGLQMTALEKMAILRHIATWLPVSNRDFKFRWATRVVLKVGLTVSNQFIEKIAPILHINVDYFNGTETPVNLADSLNTMVRIDSGGAMRNTFEEDDFSTGACSILLNTMYVRASWRSPPTVLNGSYLFRDTEETPQRSVRMIRINDIMRYAVLKEWRTEALEITYTIPDLKLLLLIPQGHSIRALSKSMATTKLTKIYERMRTMRVAAILPIYTLRMTLLLPGKLQTMGMSRLVNASVNSSDCEELRLSHAVQRLMFWAEAGRNAYKDDGLEWDEVPEQVVLVDRPYLFYVRWKNITLMNGNFVL